MRLQYERMDGDESRGICVIHSKCREILTKGNVKVKYSYSDVFKFLQFFYKLNDEFHIDYSDLMNRQF